MIRVGSELCLVRINSAFRCFSVLIFWILSSLAPAADPEIVADYLMGTDPAFTPMELVRDFRKDFKGLWLQALQRPEADYQRLAAETVARAHVYGIPSLVDLAPDLEKILTSPTSHPAARFAAARALIVLEHRDSAQKLFDSALKFGADLRQLVEPSLAKWDFQPARAEWTRRLSDTHTYPRDLVLALRCLGQVHEASTLELTTQMASDANRPVYIRLEAAQAAAQIAQSGLESTAEALAHESREIPVINRLCALHLLSRHTSEKTCSILTELASDNDPTVVAGALNRLMEINPDLAVPFAENAIMNEDPRVREAAVRTYDLRPSVDRIATISPLLADEHPSVREAVCRSFCRLAAQPAFDEAVRSAAMSVLAQDRWQGHVQATLVLGTLEHRPAANRLVELLESSRPEVMVHAAWGLRKLAEPQTKAAILSRIERQTIERRRSNIPGVDEQVAHLFEACAQMKIMEVESTLMNYVPKQPVPGKSVLSRASAVWALGHLLADNPKESVSQALADRVLDDADQPKEIPIVKQMAVLSLVRMKAVEHGPSLKRSLSIHAPASALDMATRWGVKELTGEELGDPESPRVPDGTWFLEPQDIPAASTP